MSIFSSYKKIFLLGFIIVILIAIPFSVYIAQKRQQATTKAARSTILSFDPASPSTNVDSTLILDIVLDPGPSSSANQVSFVKLSISFDPLKFTTVSDSLAPNPSPPNTLTSILEDPVYKSGKATISLSIGADPTKVVTEKTKIAVLKLKAIAPTSGTPTTISFDSTTQVLSIASSDQTSENVLSTSNPSSVTITGVASTTPIPTSSVSPSPSTGPLTPTPTGAVSSPSSGGGFTGGGFTQGGVTPIGIAPVCSSLSVDNLAAGTAPYSLTFTASGSDPDGTISEVSFNFGDGPVQVLTLGGGIGTSSVSSQLVHTFTRPGTYNVYAILTDDSSNLSVQNAACTQIVTINSAVAGVGPTILPPVGPGENILGIGLIGAVLTIIGGALFILL